MGEGVAGVFVKQSVVDWAAEIYCVQFTGLLVIGSVFLFHFPLLDATVNKELFCPFATTWGLLTSFP